MKLTTAAPARPDPTLRQRLERVNRRIRLRLDRMSDVTVFCLVAGLSCAAAVWSLLESDHVRVLSVSVICLVVSSLLLTTWSMLALIALLSIWTIAIANVSDVNQFSASGLIMAIVVALAALIQTRRRAALGLRRRSAESVLEQMRNRISTQANLPQLPSGWHANVAQRASRGAAFAGDFVSARLMPASATASATGPGNGQLELAMVDVSGSGLDAGPRALLLSGAIGGLLGAVPPEQFLPDANNYVLRQGWRSGFATAVYLRVDLDSFAFELRSAGHLPALLFTAADGQASRFQSTGTVLGVVDSLNVIPTRGVLGPGDALVLFTDGVVETRRQSADEGVDRLAHRIGEMLSVSGPDLLADQLVDAGDRHDDRTVVVLWNDRRARTDDSLADPSVLHPVTVG